MSDVAVIGGGVIGLSCALAAARDGQRVTLYDPQVGSGASRVAGGMIAPIGEGHPGEDAVFALSVASAQLWPEFAAGLAGEVVAATDTVLTGLDHADLADLDRQVEWASARGTAAAAVAKTELAGLVPGITTRARRGYLAAGEIAVDNDALLRALVAAVQAAGVRIEARAITDVAEIDHEQVVIATGLGAPALLPALAIHAEKGEILRLTRPAGQPPLSRVVRARVNGRALYLVPRPDGIVVGATQYEAARSDTAAPRVDGVLDLLVDATALVPGVREYTVGRVEAGLRPATRDGLPLLGRWDERLVVAAGHGRNGMLWGPITAAIVAAILAGREPEWPRGCGAAQVDPRRFE